MGVVGTVQKVFYSDGKNFPTADQELKFQQRAREYNFYFQDDWRVYAAPDREPGCALRVQQRALRSLRYAGGERQATRQPRRRRQLLPAGPGTGRLWYHNDLNNFAPAVGFSWTRPAATKPPSAAAIASPTTAS